MTSTGAISAGGLDVRRLRNFALRGLPIIAIGALAGAALGVGAAASKTSIYEATALLVIEPAATDAILLDQPMRQPVAPETVAQAVNLLPTEAVLRRASEALSDGPAVSELRRELQVAERGKTNVVAITIADSDPTRAAERANAVADAYVAVRDADAQTAVDTVIAERQAQRTQLTARIAALTAQYGQTRAADPAAVPPDLAALLAQAAAIDLQLQDLSARSSTIQADARVVEAATAPAERSSPNVTVFALMGVIAGALVGVIAAAFRNAYRDRVFDVEEAQDLTDLPLAATLDALPTRVGDATEVPLLAAADLPAALVGLRQRGGGVLLITGTGGQEPVSEAARAVAKSYQRMDIVVRRCRIGGEEPELDLRPAARPGSSRALPPRPTAGPDGEPRLIVLELPSVVGGIEAAQWAQEASRVLVVVQPNVTRRRDLLLTLSLLRGARAHVAGLLTMSGRTAAPGSATPAPAPPLDQPVGKPGLNGYPAPDPAGLVGR